MSSFAEDLNAIRKKRHITQEALAEQLNVSRTTISRWETGAMMPDLDTIKRLSQVLDYNFFDMNNSSSETPKATDVVSEDASVAKEATSAKPLSDAESTPVTDNVPTQTKPKRPFRPIVIGAILLCLVLGICLVAFGSSNGNDSSIPAQSVVAITPNQDPTHAIYFDEFPDGIGWFYGFTIEETADIPFTIHEMNTILVADNGQEFPDVFTGQQCAESWGSDTLTKGCPQSWTGGFPLQNLSGVRLLITGVDANGNELTFEGSLTLSKEVAE